MLGVVTLLKEKYDTPGGRVKQMKVNCDGSGKEPTPAYYSGKEPPSAYYSGKQPTGADYSGENRRAIRTIQLIQGGGVLMLSAGTVPLKNFITAS